MTRIRFRHLVGGVVVESDLAWCGQEEWDRSAAASDPAWSAWRGRGVVLALRLDPAVVAVPAPTSGIRRPF